MMQKLHQTTNKTEKTGAPKRKLSNQNIMTIVAATILVLAHIAILLAVLWSWRYYSIYPSLFGSAVAIVLCLMAIIDIVFFVGFNHKDMALKIVSTVMAVLLLIGGTVGSVALAKANTIVDSILDDGKSDKYETFSGAFVYYKGNKGANNFKELSDLSGKKIGMLAETSNGLTYIATNILSKEKIDYGTVDYKTNAEMMQGLLDGDVDAIVITSAYRTIYKGSDAPVAEGEGEDAAEAAAITATEESPFAKYLPDLVDFYTFEQELKVDTQRSNKNLSTDPFNVLLIGYSRTEIGSPVGLADSIILATINPQTYEVSMTSIARDSFVPIACYGGEYDKINSGRSTSRACFIETVENFLNLDIDYYMELDYLGLVQIVNAIGGIVITNPVEFELDGIYVPAGTYLADGQQALQFCRERHHMAGGDFSRQQHQKEVIIAIAKKFVESGSVSLALHAMEEAADWMSTDMTLNQLTNIFNLLLNTRNYTTLDTFDLVDFQNSRITGNGGLMYYSYSMRLPLWVYLIYQGSYDETMTHINEVMGNYKTINQTKNHLFSLSDEYFKPELYSTNYSENYMFTPDPMPPFWATLTDMSVNSALAWASANGVSLTVNYINPGDADYDANYENMVVSQSPRYGSLISEYGSGSITVMAPNEIDPDKQVPNFVEHSYKRAEEWADEHGVKIRIHFETDLEGKVGDVIKQEPKPYTSIDEVEKLEIWVKAGTFEIKFNKNGFGNDNEVPRTVTVKTGDDAIDFTTEDYTLSKYKDSKGDTYEFRGWYKNKEHTGDRIRSSADVSGDTTLYAYWVNIDCNHDWKTEKDPTCTKEGTRKCQKCGETETIEALGHDWGDWSTTKEPTCEADGEESHKCKRCGETETRKISALGHDMVYDETGATCTSDGHRHGKCSRCPKETDEVIPALGHSFEWVTISEDCDNGTTQQQKCSRCGELGETRVLSDVFPAACTAPAPDDPVEPDTLDGENSTGEGEPAGE